MKVPGDSRVKLTTIQGWWLCLLVSVLAYGLPILFGSTWFLTTGFPARVDGTRRPAYLIGYDGFSSPQLDLPYREIARQNLARGELPLWNPNSSLGIPIVAQYETQIFSAFEWVDLLLNSNWLLNVTLLGRIALAGFGLFLLARRLWEDDLTAVIAGTLYILSAYFIGFQSISGFINGAVLLPWLLFSINLAFSGKPSFPSLALIGAAFGLAATSGQPQIAIINFGATAIYGLVCLAMARGSSRWQGPLVVAAGGLIAVAIAAPQLAAFHESLQHSYTLHASPGVYFTGGTTRLNLVTPFMPMLLGPIMSPWLPNLYPGQLNAEGFPLLLGPSLTLALLLGLLASFSRRTPLSLRSRIHLWCIMLLLFAFLTVVVCGTLKWAYLWAHPGFDRINLPRYGAPLASCSIALIAAVGLRSIGTLPRWILAVGLAGTLALLATLHQLAWPALTAPLSETNAPLRSASILIAEVTSWGTLLAVCVVLLARGRRAPASAATGCLILILAELMFCVRFGFDLRHELWRLVPWGAALVAGLAWAWQKPRWAIAAGGTAVLVLLGLCYSAPNFLEKARNPYKESVPQLRLLQENLGPNSVRGRVLTSQWLMTPNTLAVYGVNQMGGLNPVQPDLAAKWFVTALTTKVVDSALPVAWHGMIEDPRWPSWSDYAENRLIYNFMGVRLLAETSRHELTALALPDLKLVLDHAECRIWEDTRVWPRAFLAQGPFVSTATNAAAQAIALASRTKPGFPHLAITAPPERLVGLQTDQTDLTITAVSRFDQHATHATIEASSPQPALLVVTDVYYPGWRVWVDGVEKEIWPVQGVMRGVFFPAGAHIVEFRYRPGWLSLTISLTIAGWLVVLTAGGLAIRHHRRSTMIGS